MVRTRRARRHWEANRRRSRSASRRPPATIVALWLQAYGLTSRQADVALGVLRHHSSAKVAARLHLSRWTVRDQLKAVFVKTGVRSRTDLALQLFSLHTGDGGQRHAAM